MLVLLSFALALLVACGGGGGDGRLTLKGEDLQNFLRPMLLTAEDFPIAPATENAEEFYDDPADVPADYIGVNALDNADWLGTLSHAYFIRATEPVGPTFAFPNTVLAFETPESASSWFGELQQGYVEEFGTQLADQFPGSNFELVEMGLAVGDESSSFYLSGDSAIPDAPAELLSALVAFRRGPIVGIVGMSGFVPLDEPFLEQTSALMDQRIQDALDEN